MHGNAGNIGHRLPIAKVFAEQMGCNIFMLSYRGYGFSTGRPSEKGLLIDAQTALDFLLSHPASSSTHIYIYGQSLGGALAIQTAARNQDQIAGLILENTFRSMRTLIPSAFPPAKYLARLCHQIWPSEVTIQEISEVPVLFLSGLRDELVPPEHMKKLYDVTKAPKVWREFENGNHNETVSEPKYFERIYEFILAVKKDQLEKLGVVRSGKSNGKEKDGEKLQSAEEKMRPKEAGRGPRARKVVSGSGERKGSEDL